MSTPYGEDVVNIGIVGSRRRNDHKDYLLVHNKFFSILDDFRIINPVIVSGGCSRGADRFAERLAFMYQIPIKIFKADWWKFKLGAGKRRNTDIAKESNILIACVTTDRTGGTEDTVKKFTYFHGTQYLYLV